MHEQIITSNQETDPDIRTPEVVDSAFMSISERHDTLGKFAHK